MSDFVSRFTKINPVSGCGVTVDAHATEENFDVIQYLWAAPISKLETISVEAAKEHVRAAAQDAGFVAEDVFPYQTHLPNESAVLDSCPFQPELCKGQHLVISGAGKAL